MQKGSDINYSFCVFFSSQQKNATTNTIQSKEGKHTLRREKEREQREQMQKNEQKAKRANIEMRDREERERESMMESEMKFESGMENKAEK